MEKAALTLMHVTWLESDGGPMENEGHKLFCSDPFYVGFPKATEINKPGTSLKKGGTPSQLTGSSHKVDHPLSIALIGAVEGERCNH